MYMCTDIYICDTCVYMYDRTVATLLVELCMCTCMNDWVRVLTFSGNVCTRYVCVYHIRKCFKVIHIYMYVKNVHVSNVSKVKYCIISF